MIRMSLVTGLFFLALLLNQRWSPPLRLQASHCSTFRIMCDVPSIAVFCSESIKCFPGTASKFFFRLLVTIPVAPVITGITVNFRFHTRCISIHKLLYFNFFSASFCTTLLSAGIATSISVHVFSFLFLIIISDLFAVTSLSVCTALFHLLLLLLLLLPVLFQSCTSICNIEKTNHSQTIMYGGLLPILRKLKFVSVNCICDQFEGNVHIVIRNKELLVSSCRKFAFAVLKAWKVQQAIGVCVNC